MQMTILRHAVLLLRSHLNRELVDRKGPWVKSFVFDWAEATSTAAKERMNGSAPEQRCNTGAAGRSLKAVQTMMQVPAYSCHSEMLR